METTNRCSKCGLGVGDKVVFRKKDYPYRSFRGTIEDMNRLSFGSTWVVLLKGKWDSSTNELEKTHFMCACYAAPNWSKEIDNPQLELFS